MSNRANKFKKIVHQNTQNIPDVTTVEAEFLGLITKPKTSSNTNAYLALKYYQPDHECFSEWTADELKAFSEFSRKLNQQTWQQVFQSGGKIGNKTGVGYTLHKDRSKLPQSAVLDSISEDINFFELRVTDKARVHGFRSISTFFLVWLDRNHQVYPM